MSDTTRQAGFGLSKQNTAGPTAGHSNFPRFHGTEVPGQRQTGPAWRRQPIHDITVAPGEGAIEAGRGYPCCGPPTSLGALALHYLLHTVTPLPGREGSRSSSSPQHRVASIHSFSLRKLSTYSEPSLLLGTKACTKEQDIVPSLQELLLRGAEEQTTRRQSVGCSVRKRRAPSSCTRSSTGAVALGSGYRVRV